MKPSNEILFYYRTLQLKPSISTGPFFTDIFIDIKSNKGEDSEDGELEGMFDGMNDGSSSEDIFEAMKLKLKPESKIKAEINLDIEMEKIENSQNHALKASRLKEALKQKKAQLLKKWQHILADFSLHLKKIGKSHLIRDCVLDTSAGKILFLSREVLFEFLKFRPDIKSRLRFVPVSASSPQRKIRKQFCPN